MQVNPRTDSAHSGGAHPSHTAQEPAEYVRERGGAHPDSMDFGGAEHGGHDEHAHLPPPSIWPITMALGLAMGFGGIVLDWEVSALGGMTAIWAFVNWIQELRHENP